MIVGALFVDDFVEQVAVAAILGQAGDSARGPLSGLIDVPDVVLEPEPASCVLVWNPAVSLPEIVVVSFHTWLSKSSQVPMPPGDREYESVAVTLRKPEFSPYE